MTEVYIQGKYPKPAKAPIVLFNSSKQKKWISEIVTSKNQKDWLTAEIFHPPLRLKTII